MVKVSIGRSEVSKSVVKWSEGLRNRVSIVIRRYTDRMELYCFFRTILYHCIYGCMFCVFLFNFVCYVLLLLLLFRSWCCVSLCCSVYCLCLMCTVLLPPGVKPTTVNKYIISYLIISYHIKSLLNMR